jgi:hypothetical protein
MEAVKDVKSSLLIREPSYDVRDNSAYVDFFTVNEDRKVEEAKAGAVRTASFTKI